MANLDEEADEEVESEVESEVAAAAAGCVVGVTVEVATDEVVGVVDTTRFAEEEDATNGEAAEWDGACVLVVAIAMDEELEELEELAAAAAGSAVARRASFGPGCRSRTSLIEVRFCIVKCLRMFGDISRTIEDSKDRSNNERTVVARRRRTNEFLASRVLYIVYDHEECE